MDQPAPEPVVPETPPSRWHPHRIGLLNLYRFDRQEFIFEKGRLLLRGNNGTGKTRALALTLPFLLDGRTHPAYVEPDGDPAKQMAWNLLLGKYEERVGYTWLEFAITDPKNTNGDEPLSRYCTIGCGLRAVRGRPGVETWFFITEQRLGVDFSLERPSGAVKRRPELEETLGNKGEIFTAAQDYRRALDAKLFGLGERRYEALIKLLIALRKPQLSRQLDERALSQALSEALPPLPDDVIEEVAEAFGDLEAERDALTGLAQSIDAVKHFLASYRSYARAATRRRAATLRAAHSDYKRLRQSQRDAELAQSEAQGRYDDAEERLADLGPRLAAAEQTVTTLRQSPELRQAAELEDLRRAAKSREAERQEAEQEHQRAEIAKEEATTRRDSAQHACSQAAEAQAKAKDAASRASIPAGLDQAHRLSFESSDKLSLETSGKKAEKAISQLSAQCVARRRAIRDLETYCRDFEHAEEIVHRERARADEARSALEEGQGLLADARRSHRHEGELLRQVVDGWIAGLVELPLGGLVAKELAEELARWCESTDESDPITPWLQSASTARRDAITKARVTEEAEGERLKTGLGELESERKRVLKGVHDGPPPPPWREAEVRKGRPGAPLWALCDFAPELAATERAGVEAALEASGLLDAWVAPEGALIDPSTNDVFLAQGDDSLASDTGDAATTGQAASLTQVLVAAIDPMDPQARQVSADTVNALLRRVALPSPDGDNTIYAHNTLAEAQGQREHALRVGIDGGFVVGPLFGRYHKETAEHLGHAAREETRRRELRRLGAEIDAVEEAIGRSDDSLARLDASRHALDAEVASRPDTGKVLAAAHEAVVQERRVVDLRDRFEAAQENHNEALRVRDAKMRTRDSLALELKLEASLIALDRAERDVAAYAETLRTLDRTLLSWRDAEERVVEHDEALRRAEILADQAHTRKRRTRDHAAAAKAAYEALEASLGSTIDALRARLREAEAEVTTLIATRDATREARHEADLARARAATQVEERQAQVETRRASREAAVDALHVLVEAGLLTEAAPGDLAEASATQSWAPRPAVDLARLIDSQLGGAIDDAEYKRRHTAIHGAFRQLQLVLLDQDLHPDLHYPDAELPVVRVSHQGHESGVTGLLRALEGEAEARRRVLSEREREVIENHLIGEVAMQLHAHLRAAEDLVSHMNAELARRPTSTGMLLRFRWAASDDAPEGFAPFRARLLATVAVWSPQDREAVGRFLQRCIELESQRDEASTRREQLQRALDYRAWHGFSIERRQDGLWKALTKRSHGTGSGGEKAIALTIPQFAAAAAHYKTARETAPRLILLDEAFVGIDSDMRAKSMAMLEAFDLDFMMTSEREWGCYAELSGLSIYQLHADATIDAVGALRWVWNGKERIERFDAMTPPPPPPARSSRPAPEDSAQLRLDSLVDAGATGSSGSSGSGKSDTSGDPQNSADPSAL